MSRWTETRRQLSMERAAAMIAGDEKEVARVERAIQSEVTMAALEEMYEAARASLITGVGRAIAELATLNAQRETLPAGYYLRERARVIYDVQLADRKATGAAEAYQQATMKEARRLRAKAEVSVDPQVRVAEMAERKMLAEGNLDVSELLRQAAEMADAEQPKRAALLLAAATDKGIPPAASLGASELRHTVETMLDMDGDRLAARTVEERLSANLADYRAARLKALYDSGLGTADDGSVGSGSTRQKGNAGLRQIVEAFAKSQATGEPYVAPIPEIETVSQVDERMSTAELVRQRKRDA